MPPKKKLKKKINRRSAAKFPGLKKQYNLKTRQDLLENDYYHLLNDKEKEWLNRFNEETINANFNHGGKILNKTKKMKKECYGKNNARNRDLYLKAQITGKLISTGVKTSIDSGGYVQNEKGSDPTDAIIDFLDSKKLKK